MEKSKKKTHSYKENIIRELEKEISYWKLEFQEKTKSMENMKQTVKKSQGYEVKYNILLEKYHSNS